MYLKSATCSIILSFITIFYPLYVVFPHCHWFSFVLELVVLCFHAIRRRWYAIVCSSSSDVAIKIWSTAYSTVFTNFLWLSCIHIFIIYFKFLYNFINLHNEQYRWEAAFLSYSLIYVYWFRYTIIKFKPNFRIPINTFIVFSKYFVILLSIISRIQETPKSSLHLYESPPCINSHQATNFHDL